MEYLESTLPPEIRKRLWSRLSTPARPKEGMRTSDSMAEELLRTQIDLVVDRDELKRG